MGSLTHLIPGNGSVMDDQFNRVNDELQKSVNALIKQTRDSQDASFSNAVQNVILAINNSQAVMTSSLSRLSDELLRTQQALSKDIAAATDTKTLENQLTALGLQVDALPNEYPIPKDVDLSGLSKEIQSLKATVQSIPVPVMPKPVDLMPQLKKMEKTILEAGANRVVEFDVIRDPINNDIEKIVVTEGVA